MTVRVALGSILAILCVSCATEPSKDGEVKPEQKIIFLEEKPSKDCKYVSNLKGETELDLRRGAIDWSEREGKQANLIFPTFKGTQYWAGELYVCKDAKLEVKKIEDREKEKKEKKKKASAPSSAFEGLPNYLRSPRDLFSSPRRSF